MDELKKLERLERALWTRIKSLEARIETVETSYHALAIDLGSIISQDGDFDNKVMEILAQHQESIMELDARSRSKGNKDGAYQRNLMDIFVETDKVFRIRHIAERYCGKHKVVFSDRPMIDVIGDIMLVDGNAFFEEINAVLFGENVPEEIVSKLEALRMQAVPSEDLIDNTDSEDDDGGKKKFH